MRSINLLFALFFVMSCSSIPVKTKLLSDVNVDVRHLGKDDWLITYKFPEPVRGVAFNRQLNQFRHENWTVETPGIRLQVSEGQERIFSTDHAPFDTVQIRLKSYFVTTPKDYEFFVRYTDGSALMYTGHYNILSLQGDNPETAKAIDDHEPLHHFTFTPAKGENIVVLGKVTRNSSLTWDDSEKQGTYVYFGNIDPIETDYITAVVDPGLPQWLLKKTKLFLPKLFKFYSEKTGYHLTFKPAVYFNYVPGEKDRQNNKGGTLPGLIQLALEGQDWKKEEHDQLAHLFKFLAHESAHLWNGQLFSDFGGHVWMHEGGADAFAYKTLLTLGIIDKKEYVDDLNGALTQCSSELFETPLNKAKEKKLFGLYYSCGTMINLLAEAASLRSSKVDLYGFWKRLFDKANLRNPKKYDAEMYFETLLELGKDDILVSKIKELIETQLTDPSAFLKDVLTSQGIVITETVTSKSSNRGFGRKILSALMQYDCKGKISISARKDRISVEGLPSCEHMKSNHEVIGLGPYHIIKQGALAYSWVFEQCAQNLPIPVKTTKETYSIPCSGLTGKSQPLEIKSVSWL